MKRVVILEWPPQTLVHELLRLHVRIKKEGASAVRQAQEHAFLSRVLREDENAQAGPAVAAAAAAAPATISASAGAAMSDLLGRAVGGRNV